MAALPALALGLSAVGTVVSAGATLAGGAAANQAAQYQAQQLDQNAQEERAAGQRKSMERDLQTRLALSASRARAAASGVNAATGSPLLNEEQIAGRGKYQALMEGFNAENTATGLENKAAATRFEGEAKQSQSLLASIGTLAGGAGSIFKEYGDITYGKNRWA